MAYTPSKLRKKFEWLFRRAEGALLGLGVREGEGAHLDPDGARLAIQASADDLAIVSAEARFDHFQRALRDVGERSSYVGAYGVCGVRRFMAADGTRVYQLEVETFPRHVNNVHVIVSQGSTIMLDCGSGLPSSRRDLALRFAIVRDAFEEDVRWEDLDWCLISHAHMDHYGGLNHLRKTSRARVAVHELDARVIACFDERLVLAMKDLELYWRRAGISDAERIAMRDLYHTGKKLFRPEPIDLLLRDSDSFAEGYVIHHVPGHCPGLVCLQVRDVLLTSDHVLARITPHQFPQAITPYAGLGHYLASLAKIRRLDGISLALGGHEEPIVDLRGRIDEIIEFHRARLDRVQAICASPSTVADVVRGMFGEQEGYGRILAIDEAGAHVEYLHQLGRLRVDNLDEVAASDNPVMRYVAR